MRKRYTTEFKLQALELVNQLGSYMEASRQLGISDGALHNWKNKLNFEIKIDSEKKLNSTLESEEVRRLKKEK